MFVLVGGLILDYRHLIHVLTSDRNLESGSHALGLLGPLFVPVPGYITLCINLMSPGPKVRLGFHNHCHLWISQGPQKNQLLNPGKNLCSHSLNMHASGVHQYRKGAIEVNLLRISLKCGNHIATVLQDITMSG